ncbi:hypothetical protein G9A89_015833 [Geosiphon pyriformis]|nr:hypothetical protein G9A89_015833 [Geosiphon pyriformis]
MSLEIQEILSSGMPSNIPNRQKLLGRENSFGTLESHSNTSNKISIDLEALKNYARQIFDQKCTTLQKLGENDFHETYLLTMDDSTEYIARIAFPEYPKWKTESEVGVMKYVKEKASNIPVPTIFHWESSAENPVGTEFIIMERLPGVALSQVWDSLSLQNRKEILLQVIEIQCTLKNLSFPKIGGIFLDDKSSDGFKIGQAVEFTFFKEDRYLLSLDRGPFETTCEYVMAAANKEIIYRRNNTSPQHQAKWVPVFEELASLVSSHFSDDQMQKFILTHGDFHSTNILVRGTEITGIIGWECSGSYPIECFCDYPAWILDDPMVRFQDQEENFQLQEFWYEEMERRDPEFIQILEDLNDMRVGIYEAVFINFDLGGRIVSFLQNLPKEHGRKTRSPLMKRSLRVQQIFVDCQTWVTKKADKVGKAIFCSSKTLTDDIFEEG